MKWYPRDSDAALVGMRSLSDEQYKAYNTILDLLYSRDGNVPDEERFMCSHLDWDPRKWRRVRAQLLALGKIQTIGGRLTNYRATSEVTMAIHRMNIGRKLRQIQLEKQRADAGVAAGITITTINNLTSLSSVLGAEEKVDGRESKPASWDLKEVVRASANERKVRHAQEARAALEASVRARGRA